MRRSIELRLLVSMLFGLARWEQAGRVTLLMTLHAGSGSGSSIGAIYEHIFITMDTLTRRGLVCDVEVRFVILLLIQ